MRCGRALAEKMIAYIEALYPGYTLDTTVEELAAQYSPAIAPNYIALILELAEGNPDA